jgi:hypothetical protein
VTTYRITWLCTDCGLYAHSEQAAAAHRDESGHTRVAVLTSDRTAERAERKRRLRDERGPRPPQQQQRSQRRPLNADLDERLAAMFGRPT